MGSNDPYSGTKNTYLEGGLRSAGFIASPLLNQTGQEFTGLIHISDWFPTFAALAQADVSEIELDGFNQWNAIRY